MKHYSNALQHDDSAYHAIDSPDDFFDRRIGFIDWENIRESVYLPPLAGESWDEEFLMLYHDDGTIIHISGYHLMALASTDMAKHETIIITDILRYPMNP